MNRPIAILLSLWAAWSVSSAEGQQCRLRLRDFPVSIVPAPVTLEQTDSFFIIPRDITCDEAFGSAEIEMLSKTFRSRIDMRSVVRYDNNNPILRYRIDKGLDAEEYILGIDSCGVEIVSSDTAGRLWGVQTFRQILDCAAYFQQGDIKALPFTHIKDKPMYQWRGFHTDLSRHMFTVDYLKELIDRLSYLKISQFHLHLTDDQGWRLQIDSYPLLTEIGSVRQFNDMDSVSLCRSKYSPDKRLNPRFVPREGCYGGYYTKAEMRELVVYAEQRGVNIVPEIDMPGHLSAAQRAYPFLSCVSKSGFGKEFSFPMCVGNPESMVFAKKIIDELCDIFPSKYIHIGADEVERDNWDKCPRCKKLMKQKQMHSSVEIERYFVSEIADYVISKGRGPIVWDDAFAGESDLNVQYMFWRDWRNEQPKKIIDAGKPLIWTSWEHFYLSSGPSDRQFKALYEFNPKEKYGIDDVSVFRGWQACMWDEYVFNEQQHQWHIYPTLYAFAEKAWGTADDFDDFERRMQPQYYVLTADGINYKVLNVD